MTHPTPEREALLKLCDSVLSEHERAMQCGFYDPLVEYAPIAHFAKQNLTAHTPPWFPDWFRDIEPLAKAASDKLDRAGYYDEATLVIQLLNLALRSLPSTPIGEQGRVANIEIFCICHFGKLVDNCPLHGPPGYDQSQSQNQCGACQRDEHKDCSGWCFCSCQTHTGQPRVVLDDISKAHVATKASLQAQVADDMRALGLAPPLPQAPGVEGAVQETPETDEKEMSASRCTMTTQVVLSDFARTLERERNEARRGKNEYTASLLEQVTKGQNTIERQRQRIYELEERLNEAWRENICDACAGTGKPISGLPCMCGGTGKMSDAAIRLREQLVALQSAQEKKP